MAISVIRKLFDFLASISAISSPTSRFRFFTDLAEGGLCRPEPPATGGGDGDRLASALCGPGGPGGPWRTSGASWGPCRGPGVGTVSPSLMWAATSAYVLLAVSSSLPDVLTSAALVTRFGYFITSACLKRIKSVDGKFCLTVLVEGFSSLSEINRRFLITIIRKFLLFPS